jgi:hypothetical protein
MFARMGQERGALLRVCACRQRLLSTTAPILNYICGIELALKSSGPCCGYPRVLPSIAEIIRVCLPACELA